MVFVVFCLHIFRQWYSKPTRQKTREFVCGSLRNNFSFYFIVFSELTNEIYYKEFIQFDKQKWMRAIFEVFYSSIYLLFCFFVYLHLQKLMFLPASCVKFISSFNSFFIRIYHNFALKLIIITLIDYFFLWNAVGCSSLMLSNLSMLCSI